ncbi:MAG: hypothetical protein QW035_04515 [Candidatus Anstonellales archaeon]
MQVEKIETLFLIAAILLLFSYLESPAAGAFAAVCAYIFCSIEKDEVSALPAIGAMYIMAIIAVAPANALSYIWVYLYIPLAIALPFIYALSIGAQKSGGNVQSQRS